MFESFVTYVEDWPKPQLFSINKGNVKVVNSSENFWIRYPENLRDRVSITADDHNVKVNVEKDNAEIIVNISKLHQCSVKLQAGNMEVDHLCAKSSMAVGSGTLNAHVSKLGAGEVKGHVDTGLLHNSSNLKAQASQPSGGWNMGPMGAFNQFTQPFHNDITLMGNDGGCTADFHVGSGMLNLD